MPQMDDPETILPRGMRYAIAEAIQDTPVVCLLGPRQCGKSTLVKTLAPGREYLTLDSPTLLAAATKDPEGFINQFPWTR